MMKSIIFLELKLQDLLRYTARMNCLGWDRETFLGGAVQLNVMYTLKMNRQNQRILHLHILVCGIEVPYNMLVTSFVGSQGGIGESWSLINGRVKQEMVKAKTRGLRNYDHIFNFPESMKSRPAHDYECPTIDFMLHVFHDNIFALPKSIEHLLAYLILQPVLYIKKKTSLRDLCCAALCSNEMHDEAWRFFQRLQWLFYYMRVEEVPDETQSIQFAYFLNLIVFAKFYWDNAIPEWAKTIFDQHVQLTEYRF